MERRGRKSLTSFLIACALVALPAASAFAQVAALTGVVRDSAGAVVRDAEVIVRDGNRATRTNERGEFTIADIAPGNHTIWFRRLGYRSVEYNWPARAGERTSVDVVLHAIARQLDPVVVRAEEDKRAATSGSILGLVVDTDGNPIPEAEVQLVGANMSGLTRSNGGVLFKPLTAGTYVVRVRKLGFEPAVVTLQLVDRDDREIVVRMHSLARDLDPTVVSERSGYGRDQAAWDELDRRKRYVSFLSRFVGPEDLKSFYGASLDLALVRLNLYRPGASARSRIPTSIDAGAVSTRPILADESDACILLNGTTPVRQPLRTFTTDEIELLEVWPPGTELSGTVSSHFAGACQAKSTLEHPTYFVLWMKNRQP